MNTRNRILLGVVILILILNIIPMIGLFRALPISDGQGGVQPLGVHFQGTPLYTTEHLDGDVIDYSVWAATRSIKGENVYDLKPWKRTYDIFPYPPLLLYVGFFLLLFSPFHYYIWLIFLIAAVVTVAYVANAILKEKKVGKYERWIVIALIVTAQGITRNIGYGHYFVIAFALMLLTYWLTEKNEWGAGVAWGFLNCILLYGFILIPWFIIKRKWKTLTLGIIIPLIPLFALLITNPASFYGFFPFMASGSSFGMIIEGAPFSIIRLIHGIPWLYFLFLAIQGITFLAVTYAFWRNKKMTDAQYFAFIPVFLLVTEPWFSGHHSIIAMITYLLLYNRNLIIPFALTEANYQNITGQAPLWGFGRATYFLFIGTFIAYIIALKNVLPATIDTIRKFIKTRG